MMTKMLAALGIYAALMAGGVSVAAAESRDGDCLQPKDQLRLRDGTGENCTCDLDALAADGTRDDCNDHDWNFLYGETELEPPHQSSCGGE